MAHSHLFIGHEGGRQLFIRRALVFSPVIFLLAVAQCSFFAQLKILPAVPDLMIGVIVAIAMLDSQKAAVVCGISTSSPIMGRRIMPKPKFFLISGKGLFIRVPPKFCFFIS